MSLLNRSALINRNFIALALLSATFLSATVCGAESIALRDIPAGDFQRGLTLLDATTQHQALQKAGGWAYTDTGALRVDPRGNIWYACAKPVLAPKSLRAPSPTTGRASVPISTPPVHDSKPGSANVLYLDFNGMTITGTAWNSSVTTYVARPYSLDSDYTTFSDAEQAAITAIWERVAEDYAPFDVNVTTVQPSTFTATTGHALITPSIDANGATLPAGGSAGGVAYVDVFGSPDYVSYYSPVFVYTDNLGNQEDIIAEATSHELGHNMGLHHDGRTTPTEAYYYGHSGGGVPDWAPIMGAGYDKNITQWSKGEYTNANNAGEDDLSIISAKLAYRPDDYGNTPATATSLTLTGSNLPTRTGVIEQSTDIDFFSVTLPTGTLSLSVLPYRNGSYTWGGNLDALVTVLDANGVVVVTENPSAETTVATNVPILTAGIYYISIASTGAGTPLASTPTGYTSYGSIGQYTLSGSISFVANGGTPSIQSATISSNIVLTGTTSVTATDDGGESNLRYTWTTDSAPVGAAAPVFSINGTNDAKATNVTFAAPGNYVLRVTAQDSASVPQSTFTTIPVTITAVVASMSLSLNGSSDILVGSTRTFSTQSLDQFGAPFPNGAPQWSVNSGGTIDATSGLFTASTTPISNRTVTAVDAGISATAIFSVIDTPPVVTSLISTPISATSVQLAVVATDNLAESNLVYFWSTPTKPTGASAPVFSTTGANKSKTTTVTVSTPGSYKFSVLVRDANLLYVTQSITVDLTGSAASTSTTTSSTGAAAPSDSGDSSKSCGIGGLAVILCGVVCSSFLLRRQRRI